MSCYSPGLLFSVRDGKCYGSKRELLAAGGKWAGGWKGRVEQKQGNTSGQMAIWEGDCYDELGFCLLGTGRQE